MENSHARQTTSVRRRPLSSRSISLENAKVNCMKKKCLFFVIYASSYLRVEQLQIFKWAQYLNSLYFKKT